MNINEFTISQQIIQANLAKVKLEAQKQIVENTIREVESSKLLSDTKLWEATIKKLLDNGIDTVEKLFLTPKTKLEQIVTNPLSFASLMRFIWDNSVKSSEVVKVEEEKVEEQITNK